MKTLKEAQKKKMRENAAKKRAIKKKMDKVAKKVHDTYLQSQQRNLRRNKQKETEIRIW